MTPNPSDVENGYALVMPDTLKTRPPFSDLFPIVSSVIEAITASMADQGYDQSKPINVWRQENVIVDGHQRQKAATALGIPVAVFYHDFADEDVAFEYAVKCQRDRRNLTDSDILRLVELVDSRASHGGDRRSENFKVPTGTLKPREKSAKATGDLIGINYRRVERARAILDHAPEEVKQAVKEGRKSLYMGDRDVCLGRKANGAPRSQMGSKVKPTKFNGKPIPPQAIAPRSQEPTIGVTDADAAWLASFTLRSRVIARYFDDDARLARLVRERFAALGTEIDALLGPRSPDCRSHVHRLIASLIDLAPIESWNACSKCGGSGVGGARGYCGACRGAGFLIPNL